MYIFTLKFSYFSLLGQGDRSFVLKGFEIQWKGTGIDEIGFDKHTGRELIFVSKKYFRPVEVEELLGNSEKARKELACF